VKVSGFIHIVIGPCKNLPFGTFHVAVPSASGISLYSRRILPISSLLPQSIMIGRGTMFCGP